jgi:hypothetical protein
MLFGSVRLETSEGQTTIPEVFLDAELEQFLNEAVEECYEKVRLLADRANNDPV